MINVEVIVIGSGIAALKALQTAKQCGKKALAVDPSYSNGGYIQLLDSDYLIPKAPLFIHSSDVDFFQSLGIDLECLNVELDVLKEGGYIAKTLGFTDIIVQKNWFYEWVNSKELCLHKNLFYEIKKTLGFEYTKPIHAVSSIRKIDLERKVVVLTTGELVKYKQLVYTWPLPRLPELLFPEEVKNYASKLISSLNLKQISSYIMTAVVSESSGVEKKIKIYIHSTKASKMHTAITFNVDNHQVLYVITSHSNNYPLLPGINEKLLSEVRKFKITSPKNIIKEYGLNITYTLINNVDIQQLEEVKQKLEEYNVHLFGRLGLWKDQTVKEILQNKELQQITC